MTIAITSCKENAVLETIVKRFTQLMNRRSNSYNLSVPILKITALKIWRIITMRKMKSRRLKISPCKQVQKISLRSNRRKFPLNPNPSKHPCLLLLLFLLGSSQGSLKLCKNPKKDLLAMICQDSLWFSSTITCHQTLSKRTSSCISIKYLNLVN